MVQFEDTTSSFVEGSTDTSVCLLLIGQSDIPITVTLNTISGTTEGEKSITNTSISSIFTCSQEK